MIRSAFVDLSREIYKHANEYPLTVKEAAKFLGVSPQLCWVTHSSMYLWVERKQIPTSPRDGPKHPSS